MRNQHGRTPEKESVFVLIERVALLVLAVIGRTLLSALSWLNHAARGFARGVKQFLFSNTLTIEYGRPTEGKGTFTWFKRIGWLLLFWLGGVVIVSCTAELLKKIIFSGIH